MNIRTKKERTAFLWWIAEGFACLILLVVIILAIIEIFQP
jgi:hypothetical protein